MNQLIVKTKFLYSVFYMVSEHFSSNEQTQISFFHDMATQQSTFVVTNAPPIAQNLIAINAVAQLLVKLSPTNYPSWRAQFSSLLFGYDLIGFIDGSNPSPPPIIT